MTRKALIELVTRRLKFTDSKNQFSMPYVQGQIDIVWQDLCVKTYNENIIDSFFYTKLHTPVTITNPASGLAYADVPEEMIRLPRIGEGIISINQIDSRSADFKPIREKDYRLMTSQEVYRTGGDIYWYLRYDRVFFGESITNDIITAGVDMNICIPFSKYDLDEELPLPGGQAEAFMEMAVNYLSGTPIVNTDNKNAV